METRHRVLICWSLMLLAASGCTSRVDDDQVTAHVANSELAATARHKWSLKESETKYLWDLEHHSNILVKFGFGAIAAALREQDDEALRRQCSADFAGSVFKQAQSVEVQDAVLTASRETLRDESRQPLDADEFTAFLIEHCHRFASEPRVRFDVKTISPQQRNDLTQNWTALCVMRMWGDCHGDQPGELSVLFRAEFVEPTKANMNAPGWLLGCAIEQVATNQASQFLFREVAAGYNLDVGRLADNWTSEEKYPNTGGIFACDFNRDNCVDLFITDVNPKGNGLFKGLPEGGFEDVTKEVGLQALRALRPPFCAAFVDLDNDGWEDLVFAEGIIWRNLQGQRFKSVTHESNMMELVQGFHQATEKSVYGLTVADYDRDGAMDLYVIRSGGLPVSWLEDTLREPVRNLLLRNVGNWQFADETLTSKTDAAARSVFTTLWFDANNDLWPDLYVINEFGDGVLYVNQTDGSFRELDIDKSTDDFGSMGLTCGDIDNDGNVDLYLAGMYSKAGSRVVGNMPRGVYPEDVMSRLRRLISGSELYQNEGDLKFESRASQYQVNDVGWAWGPTMADFNNDGFLDIFATAGYMSRDRQKPDG